MEPEGSCIHKCPSHVPILSQFDPIHAPPHPTSWRFIFILSSHLRLVRPNGLFPSGSPTKSLYTPLLSPIRATSPTHLCTKISVQVRGLFFDCFAAWSYGEDSLAPRPTPHLEDHPFSAVRYCIFNIFAATLHIAGRSSIHNLSTCHAVVQGPTYNGHEVNKNGKIKKVKFTL